MYLSRSGLLDPEEDCAPFLGRAEDVGAMLSAPLTDSAGGRILWSGSTAAAREAMGEYGAPVEAEMGRFWRMASDDAPKPRGLLARFTRDPLRFISVQGRAYHYRDATWCLTRPFLAPISFPESFSGAGLASVFCFFCIG